MYITSFFRTLFFILGVSLYLPDVFTQPVSDPQFKASFAKKDVKVGDEVTIVFSVDLPDKWHMYSTNYNPECGPGPLEFEFELSDAYQLIGEPVSIGDKKHFDNILECDVSEFWGKAEIHQKIRILKNSANSVSGNIKGQWCDEGQCYRFGYGKPLTFKARGLRISGKPTDFIPQLTPDVDSVSKSADSLSPVSSDTLTKLHLPADTEQLPSYRKTTDSDSVGCNTKLFNGQKDSNEDIGYWSLFVIAFLAGLGGLLTPCVFPMIPMTVSFFMKDKKKKTSAVFYGFFFGISIITIYIVIGTLAAVIFGADVGSVISTHWLPNVLFFIIFLVFAASFFGAFEITMPAGLVNKVDREADKGGLYGVFFMALTIALVSFSCTGPIVGSVLVESAGGAWIRPIIAMFGFGLAFALPFALFAVFPQWLSSLPKSGGWLNSVKVCLGFIEVAFAFKFLSTADQTYHWRLLDREVYLSIWIVVFLLMGIYLLGKLKFAHDSEVKFLGVTRLFLAGTTLSFVIYMIPGLWGAPLKFLSGYLPPMHTQDFDIHRSVMESQGISGNMCGKASYSDKLHFPHGLTGYFDYDEAVECSKSLNKPLFIDFTGHGCVNCRKMEEKVWSDPRILTILRNEYVLASLYVDDKVLMLPQNDYFTGRFSNKLITKLGDKNTEIEICYFGASQQPLYALLDTREQLLQPTAGSQVDKNQFDAEEFLHFLEQGVLNFKKKNGNPSTL